jgi:DNA ligase-1
MRFADLAAASDAVRAASARNAKIALLAGALRALAPDEAAAGAAYLAGEVLERRLGVGWATLRDAPGPAAEPSLTVAEVAAELARIEQLTGAGSQAARREAVHALWARATEAEQRLLRGLLLGDLRQGALAGVLTDAVAKAADVPVAAVRRALTLHGFLPDVAHVALTEGAAGLAGIGLEVGRPLQPMLAGTATDVGDAMGRLGRAGVEFKLDGARIQVHRRDGDVAVFTRSLEDVTARVPEIVEAALALPAEPFVLDGEAIALRPDGRPHPFQVTASRFGSRNRTDTPLTPQLFDVLHLDGEDLLDRPAAERADALAALVPEPLRIPRETVEDEAGAAAVLARALAAGHEGVVVKSLDAPYVAGRRGAGWLKVKPVHTLDLVVLAVEWGHGRRTGWLSNLHLGARADDGSGFVMLGKTFKGLTDELLRWQTEKLKALAVDDNGWVVRVRPELVVEVAFDGVQRSPRYPGGVALRFARVLRYREDKRPDEADPLSLVKAFLPGDA